MAKDGLDLRGMKVSVVMPVYNERDTIEEILRRVDATGIVHEIIVVDDASTDGTRLFLQGLAHPRVRLICHLYNRGKGRALRTGFEAATGDIVLVQDADLEYDPADYPELIRPIADGVADVVVGSRFLGGTHRVLYFWHYLGNRFLTSLSNVLTNLNLTDMECCYKVLRTTVLRQLDLRSNRFGIEPELIARVAQLGCRVYEVPVSYFGRDYAQGKKITWKDGVAALWHILRFGLTRRRRRALPAAAPAAEAAESCAAPPEPEPEPEAKPKPKRKPRTRRRKKETTP